MPTHISVAHLALGTDATPGAIAVTVPADATGVAVFWSQYTADASYSLSGLTSSFTSGGLTRAQSSGTSSLGLVGVARGLVTATGSQTITPVWDEEPIVDGPIFTVVFFKEIDTGDWYRDSDYNNAQTGTAGTTASTPAIDSAATDLVYGFVAEYTTIPTPSGWTLPTGGGSSLTNSMYGAVFTANSPGASSTTFTCGSGDYPGVAAISIKAAAGGGGSSPKGAFGLALNGPLGGPIG